MAPAVVGSKLRRGTTTSHNTQQLILEDTRASLRMHYGYHGQPRARMLSLRCVKLYIDGFVMNLAS